MQFQPVWISSPEHLAQFDSIIARTSKWRRALRVYQLPAEFPRVDMGRKMLGKNVVVPLVMFSQGELTIDGDIMRYRALDLNTTTVGKTTVTRHHLRTDWQWELRAENVRAVEPFNFLLCVGGSGFEMEQIRQRSAQLAAELQKLKDSGN